MKDVYTIKLSAVHLVEKVTVDGVEVSTCIPALASERLTFDAISEGDMWLSSLPSINILPEAISPNCAMARSRVLFPVPLRPSNAVIAPHSKCAEASAISVREPNESSML